MLENKNVLLQTIGDGLRNKKEKAGRTIVDHDCYII